MLQRWWKHVVIFLIDEQLEGYRAFTITIAAIVDDIFSPGTTFNANHLIDLQFFELHSNQRTQIAWLIEVWVVILWEALGWIEFHFPNVFLIQ